MSHLSKIQNQPERIIHANLPTIETLRILPVRTLAVQTTAKKQKTEHPKSWQVGVKHIHRRKSQTNNNPSKKE